jgi:DNA-binding response OmpR family regulator
MQRHASGDPAARPELLLVDSHESCAAHVPHLRAQYRVTLAHTVDSASTAMARSTPALVVSELELPDGPADELCRRAKHLPVPATVMVTTASPERVPAALAAGCDGVLLKPFAPNLLHARLGRLLRHRYTQLHVRESANACQAAYRAAGSTALEVGTNRVWRGLHCPRCERGGVVSFDHASHQRHWFACLSCTHVWVGRGAVEL